MVTWNYLSAAWSSEVKLEDGRLWKYHTDQLKLLDLNHSSELEGHLPSDCEVNHDTDISLSLAKHSSTPIMVSQSPLTYLTPMDDSQTVFASGESLPNGLATSSIPD